MMAVPPLDREATSEVSSSDTFGMALRHVPIEELEQAFAGRPYPEWLQMYLAIAKELPLGPETGWFGPGQSSFGWDWLADFCQADPTAGITRGNFPGPVLWFDLLDRNRDGRITAEDLDWSPGAWWVQTAAVIQRLFRRMDQNSDGRLTREEWIGFFDTATQGAGHALACDLRDQWLSGFSGGYLAGDAPSRDMLVQSLFTGELGSRFEGPRVGDPAPDFVLRTPDGGREIALVEVLGPQPVVLVFGNMTCGPFRSMYPEIDRMASRFSDRARFLGVYVREAHPTDGWCMLSNECVGVSTRQPKTDEERRATASRFCDLLQPTLPWLVDDLQDSTGHAYSAMPARLYVIDAAGQITYKSGRGPFGFKPGELEQSLIMTLLAE
ncbi:redoxin domain-containing protein [bacterium]|nr:redoxin domain-containing protein [bacterium]